MRCPVYVCGKVALLLTSSVVGGSRTQNALSCGPKISSDVMRRPAVMASEPWAAVIRQDRLVQGRNWSSFAALAFW
jgi:hypothetical protein